MVAGFDGRTEDERSPFGAGCKAQVLAIRNLLLLETRGGGLRFVWSIRRGSYRAVYKGGLIAAQAKESELFFSSLTNSLKGEEEGRVYLRRLLSVSQFSRKNCSFWNVTPEGV